jgi:hypothetical protein
MTDAEIQFEIPSVDHPVLAEAAIEEAARLGVPIARLSQGSGPRMLTDEELRRYLDAAHSHGIDCFMFVSSRNSFDPLPEPLAGDAVVGEAAFADAVAELKRCAALGVDGVLVADAGLLATAGELARAEELGDLKLKTAAAMAPYNAANAALYERLGAISINAAPGSTLDDLRAMRATLRATTTLDVYVENPDDFGGGLRYREVGAIVRDLAPVMLKIGIRNSPTLFPFGGHLEQAGLDITREKIRRAALVMEELNGSRA